MKCLCYSNRFYYKDLSSEDVVAIKNDLLLYNSMLHTAYKRVYLSCFHGVKEQITPKQLKEKYGTSDYFPLSAINEARGLLKSNIKVNERLQHSVRKGSVRYRIRSQRKRSH